MFKRLWNLFNPTPAEAEEPVLELTEEVGPEITEAEVRKMTKVQIDEWAAERGVKLDRRERKDAMIEELKKHIELG